MTKFDFYWKYIERPKRIISSYFNKLFKRDNAYLINKKVKKHRNEIALYGGGHEASLLLGWTDQYDEDYYYITYDWKNGIRLSSCVGGFIWIKKRLSGFEYYQIRNVWFLNNPSIEDCLEKIKEKGIILK